MKVVTIGIYGFTADRFFNVLQAAGVEVFCDIRWRRGVRGTEYAFSNHKQLQARLEAIGIEYRHWRELAPTPEIRQCQSAVDKKERIAKRKRNLLTPAFITAYQENILADFDPQLFWAGLPSWVRVVALCCVERHPQACHRFLVADAIKQHIGAEIEHLLPD